jgi:hypothetical protein
MGLARHSPRKDDRVSIILSRKQAIVSVGEQARGRDDSSIPNSLVEGLDPGRR